MAMNINVDGKLVVGVVVLAVIALCICGSGCGAAGAMANSRNASVGGGAPTSVSASSIVGIWQITLQSGQPDTAPFVLGDRYVSASGGGGGFSSDSMGWMGAVGCANNAVIAGGSISGSGGVTFQLLAGDPAPESVQETMTMTGQMANTGSSMDGAWVVSSADGSDCATGSNSGMWSAVKVQ